MGQMPVLEVDGQRVHQSPSIARFLAKRVGLAGANDWENLIIDSVVDTLNDFRTSRCFDQKFLNNKWITIYSVRIVEVGAVAWEADEALKEKKMAHLKAEVIPFYMNKLEDTVKENNGYLALSKLTWADLYFTAGVGLLNFAIKGNLIEDYPALKGLTEKVNNLDSIKKWLAKRPVTDM